MRTHIQQVHAALKGVLFCVADERIVLLHGFIKKTQRTPQDDLELARKRMKEMET